MPPQVLLPWNRDEAISVGEAAHYARKSPGTIREWCRTRHIGRRVAGGAWMISHPALLMLLNDDSPALSAYLAGDRKSDQVGSYFDRLLITRLS